jgi:hypothetical protein
LRSSIALVPPAEVYLSAEEPSSELPDFSFDEVALTRLLGISEEQLPWLNPAYEGALSRLVTLLSASPEDSVDDLSPDDELSELDASNLLNQLLDAVKGRLDSRQARVFPVAIVYDGSAVFATHHLQRELRELIDGRAEWQSGGALDTYLGGVETRSVRGAHLGQQGDNRLTEDQRLVADYGAESVVSVAQGPPGTGKTELILHMASQALLESLDPDDVATGIRLLVCSTNNRAVDNVIDPLGRRDLPVALRVGSRRVMEQVTLPILTRTLRWLRDSREGMEASQESAAFLKTLSKVQPFRARLLAAEREKADRERAPDRLASVRDELESLPECELELSELEPLTRKLRLFSARLTAFLDRPKRTRESWRKLSSLWPSETNTLLQRLSVTVPSVTSSQPDEVDEWLEEVLETAQESLLVERRRGGLIEEREALETLLESEPKDVDEVRAAYLEVLGSHESTLHGYALQLRECWAWKHRERLARTCGDAIEILRARRSFRNLSQEVLTDLQSLFPIWGCTLLSLGNAVPFSSSIAERVVIDEAGQCHPAFAISAIYRGKRCLLIGDEYQLEPVIHIDRGEETRVLRRLGHPSIEPQYRTAGEDHCSAIKLAKRSCRDVPVLRDHFRCQPEIISVSDKLCRYGLSVHTPVQASMHPMLVEPLVGLDVQGDQAAYLGSWRNLQEADAVTSLAKILISSGISPGRIAVLTPYRGQLRTVDDAMRRAGIPLFDANDAEGGDSAQGMLFSVSTETVVSGTVHRFQGGERDIVLFSTVITKPRSLPFLNERENLLNVAVSRARRHLVVIGDRRMLGQGRFTKILEDAVGYWMPNIYPRG